MPYVTLLWEGKKPTREQPRSVSIEDCIGRLSLRRQHYRGAEPPTLPSQNPHLDDFRGPQATVVHLRGDDAPEGWPAGWYLSPATDLPPSQARKILEGYPLRDWGEH